MKELIDALNEALSFEYTAIIQYNTYSSLLKGINRIGLKEFFSKEIIEELEHSKYLADKITSLGGIPTTETKPFKITDNIKEIIEELLKSEQETIERYKKYSEIAEKMGYIDIKIQLENIIAEESQHRDELKKILSNI